MKKGLAIFCIIIALIIGSGVTALVCNWDKITTKNETETNQKAPEVETEGLQITLI